MKKTENTDPLEVKRRRVQIICGPSRTKQNFKEQCDINVIVENVLKNKLQIINNQQNQYLDVSNYNNYQESLALIFTVEERFMRLPPKIREEFKNDPAEMLYFLQQESNKQKAQELGLIPKESQAPGINANGSNLTVGESKSQDKA